MVENQIFTIPSKQSIQQVKTILKDSLPLHESEIKTTKRLYYDTFDWKLLESNGVLEAEKLEEGVRLRWFQKDNGQLLRSLQLSQTPRFIWEFPEGSFKTQLHPILDVRALLSQVTIESQVHCLKLWNKDEKTVAHVYLEANTLQESKSGPSHFLGQRLVVVSVRGYPKAWERVLSKVRKALPDLQPTTQSLLNQALDHLKIDPKTYSSKLDISLKANMTAEQAVKLIFQHIQRTLELNEQGMREDWDSEFLHDFRVCVRRIRSALGQIKQVFPADPLEQFKAEFAWLGQETGPARDLDVYLLKFDGYQKRLPTEVQSDLNPLQDFLKSQKQQVHQTLVQVLDTPRYRQLLEDWNSFLQQPFSPEETPLRAFQPIGEVADKQIWRVYQRVLREGEAIHDDSPAEMLHDLRKTCKKLRYLMEFFQTLYPSGGVKAMIKALKRLQENLGDFQDYEVQWSSLIHFGEQIAKKGPSSPSTLISIGMLVSDLKTQQMDARHQFHQRFTEFASVENQRAFENLFHHKRVSSKKSIRTSLATV